MLILGIESSCDETAAAIVEDGRIVRSNIVATQVEEHGLYGGVVPEIASRRHIEAISGVVEAALEGAGITVSEVDAIAATFAPGLIGALLVGCNFGKALSVSAGKPFVPVHHLRGHIAALYIAHPDLKPPFVCMVASGGHSHIVHVKSYTEFSVLGRTIDDAAGEAFDKVSRAMGLGYPGGPAIAKAALDGDPAVYKLPTPHAAGEFDMSFSGLKTAVLNILNDAQMKGIDVDKNSMAASFQLKVAQILSANLLGAAQKAGEKTVALAGGVAANTLLRELVGQGAAQLGMKVLLPPPVLCADNGAMIAAQGYFEFLQGHVGGEGQNAFATLPIDYTWPL